MLENKLSNLINNQKVQLKRYYGIQMFGWLIYNARSSTLTQVP